MKKTLWFNGFTLFLAVTLTLLSGCKQEDIVYQKSLAELNTKAQQMLQSGDVNGAISRLEAAHDLEPSEPNTIQMTPATFNARDHPVSPAIFRGPSLEL